MESDGFSWADITWRDFLAAIKQQISNNWDKYRDLCPRSLNIYPKMKDFPRAIPNVLGSQVFSELAPNYEQWPDSVALLFLIIQHRIAQTRKRLFMRYGGEAINIMISEYLDAINDEMPNPQYESLRIRPVVTLRSN